MFFLWIYSRTIPCRWRLCGRRALVGPASRCGRLPAATSTHPQTAMPDQGREPAVTQSTQVQTVGTLGHNGQDGTLACSYYRWLFRDCLSSVSGAIIRRALEKIRIQTPKLLRYFGFYFEAPNSEKCLLTSSSWFLKLWTFSLFDMLQKSNNFIFKS